LRQASPRYSPFASPVMSAPLTALSLLLSSFPRKRQSRAAGSTPRWKAQPGSAIDVGPAAARPAGFPERRLANCPSRSHAACSPVLSGRDQATATPQSQTRTADGCRCLRNYTANMAIIYLSISQVVEIAVDAERVLGVAHTRARDEKRSGPTRWNPSIPGPESSG
jgi:hypothetical protein